MINNVIEVANAMFKDYPDIVGIPDLQKMLGIKKTKAYELVQKKTIKAIKVGKDYKISKINIALYILGEKQIWKVDI